MLIEEVEFLYAAEALAAARDAAFPSLAKIDKATTRLRAAQRAFWAKLDGECDDS